MLNPNSLLALHRNQTPGRGPLGIYTLSAVFSWVTAGFNQVQLGSAGFNWVQLGSAGFSWVQPGSAGFSRVQLGLTYINYEFSAAREQPRFLLFSVQTETFLKFSGKIEKIKMRHSWDSNHGSPAFRASVLTVRLPWHTLILSIFSTL